MKSFREYLTESKRTYDFKVKIAGEFTSEQEDALKTLLGKYQVVEFKKAGKTPVQSLPLDFPKIQNAEVNIYEVKLDYPVATHELQYYLGNGLRVNEQAIVVRRPGEPSEEYQVPVEERDGALLNDPDYKEAGNVDSTQLYGDKYNASFVKTLNDELKAQRKARGEVIPTEGAGQTLNDIPQGNTSPVGSK